MKNHPFEVKANKYKPNIISIPRKEKRNRKRYRLQIYDIG